MLDGKLCRLKPGDVLSVPPRALHAIMAQTDLEWIEVQTGAELVEEDIIRVSLP
jgi:mannose-1-phosphate guanylyltransferase